MAKTNLERAQDTLFGSDGLRLKNFKMFPGESRNATAEQVAGEIIAMVDRLEAGDYEVVGDDDEE